MREQEQMSILSEVTVDRYCPYCEKRKAFSDFIKNKSKKFGVNSRCRQCESERRKARACTVKLSDKLCHKCNQVKPVQEFSTNKSSITGLSAWCNECNKWASFKKEYGLTKESYEAIFMQQSGLCAICKKPSTSLLHVDHNHTTNKVRALLCGNCNRGLGCYGDNPEYLRAAATYIEEHS